MKNIRYGRLTVVLVLTLYSIWTIFGTQSRRETPYERRQRQLEQELAALAETHPTYAAKQAELEAMRAEAAQNTPDKLRERAARLEAELSGMTPGSEDHRRKSAELANVRRMIPKWYDAFPLNLGLDLRGGTEVRMRIVSEKLERKRDRLREELEGLVPDTEAYEQKSKILVDTEAALRTNIQDAVDVIRRRLDRSGMAGIPVTQEGANRLRIQLPGMDSSTAKTIIARIRLAGRLEFRIVTDLEEDVHIKERFEQIRKDLEPNTYDICLAHGRGLRPGEINEDGLCKVHQARLYDWLEESAVKDRDGTVKEAAQLHLLRQEEDPLTGSHITTARASFDPNTGFFAVHITFDMEGTSRFGRLTTDNVNKRLAIILDKKLKSAPVIREPITGGQCEISGRFSEAEARDLAVVLKEGSLPVDLEVEMENNVGATLGEDSIARGMQAIVIGLALVLVFMAFYYLLAGLVTDFCLFLNMAFILAVFIGINAVLTLPGIAGLILTVGMAVDANVLIFERIREELIKGSVLTRAIENGYDRAVVTIIDANLTTFITALILYTFGTEAVKGFGTTLIIGIMTSMFTSLFVTRTLFHLLLDVGVLKELKMLQAVRSPQFNFVGACKQAGAVSVVLILAGLALFISRGQENYGNDFTGGILAQPNFREALPIETARTNLTTLEETLRSELESRLREETGQSDLALPAAALAGVDLQSYGLVDAGGGYRSFVFRTRSITGTDEPWAAEISEGRLADLFAEAFETAILATYPVVPDGIADMHAVPETTVQGLQLWEFTLNLPDLRSPAEVQSLLTTTELGSIRVREPGRPRFERHVTLAEIKVKMAAKDSEGKARETTPEALQQTLAGVLTALDTPAIEPAAGLTGVKQIGGVVDDQIEVRAHLELAQPQTVDELKALLLKSDALFAAAINPLDMADAPPLSTKPVEQVVVTCTANPENVTSAVDRAEAQQQFIRSQLGDLRAAGSLDYAEPFGRFTNIGPTVASEMQQAAFTALLFSMVAIFFYIWLRFQFRAAFGLGACLALAHDVLFTIGALAAIDHFFGVGIKIDLPVVAALLTIVGYSLNDTIVVFDRIRENLATGGSSLVETINNSINQTLSRTLLTSLTTLLVVLALLILGGEVIRGFAVALLVGVMVGTYSSVFIASPVLVYLDAWTRRRQQAAGETPATTS